MQFTIDFQVDHLDRALKAVRREIATPVEMLNSIGQALWSANDIRHRQGLDPEGKPWKPLAPSTLAADRRKGVTRKGGPLNRTGETLDNFHHQATNHELALGFDGVASKRAFFNHGGTQPYVINNFMGKGRRVNHPGLPARPLVGFPESDRRLVRDVIEDHLSLVLASARAR